MEFKKRLVITLACSRSKALEAGDAIASSMQSNAAYGVSQSNDKPFFEFHRVYLHIPFCLTKCGYCAFYTTKYDASSSRLLREDLCREWQYCKEQIKPKTVGSIYFGGGTPSLFGPENVAHCIDQIEPSVKEGNRAREITLEANPADLSLVTLRDYQQAGVNRLSIGVQSFDDNLLTLLQRRHTSKQAINCIENAFKVGFENISIDLMYDIPHQKKNHWVDTLHQAVALPIAHISLYNLTFEPKTQFSRNAARLTPFLPSEVDSAEMYRFAMAFLPDHQLHQYEISAFAQRGKEAFHNQGYWLGEAVMGLGPSAWSYWKGKRWQNRPNWRQYHADIQKGMRPILFEEELPREAQKRELLVLGLRLNRGISLHQFQKKYGALDIETEKRLRQLAREKMMAIDGEYCRLTKKGRIFYDTVAIELI